MKVAVLISVLAVIASGAPRETFTMTGAVVNNVTGEPVRRATVGLQCQAPDNSSNAQTLTADAGGRFEFPNVSAGKCVVWADRRGFARQNMMWDSAANPGLLIIRLTPYGVMTGKVADENGDPMIGVNVQVLQSTITMGQRAVHPANSTSTNDLGEYRVGMLAPGRYYVSASVAGGAVRGFGGVRPPAFDPGEENTTYERTYYAGASEFAGAVPIEIGPGAEGRADFRLQPAHGYTVRGRITNLTDGFTNGMAIFSSLAAADSFNGSSKPVELTFGTGEFAVRDVTPGRYTLTVRATRNMDYLMGSQTIVVSQADVTGVGIVLNKATEIAGNVRIEEKQATSGFDPQRLGIVLVPKEFGFNPRPGARLRADMNFTIPEVSPGDYLLQVTVQEPYYLKSAVIGGVDAVMNPIPIASGAVAPPLDIVIGANGGEISGTVKKDDQPAANCSVLLMRRNGAGAAQEKIVGTDGAGKFTLMSVAPGEYSVYSWQDVNAIEYRNPEVLQRYWPENVSVTEGGKHTVQLKLNTN